MHACQLFFCFFWFSQNLSFSNSRLTLGLRNFSEVGGNVHVLWLSKHCAGHGVVRARGGGGGGGGGTQDYECIIHCSYFFRSLLFACEELYLLLTLIGSRMIDIKVKKNEEGCCTDYKDNVLGLTPIARLILLVK